MNCFIYKYALSHKGSNLLDLPPGAKILSVAAVNGELVVYAEIDPNTSKIEAHVLYVVGTGWQLAHDVHTQPNRFVGTVAMPDGLVWHIYHFPPTVA